MRVNCLRSGRDLLKYMGKNTPDLILLDIQMPEMDGFETYQALRRMEEKEGRKPTPVFFLSSMETSDAEIRSFEQGAADFIRKPVHKEILIRRILNAVKHTQELELLKEEASVDKLTGFLNKAAGTMRLTKLCPERTGKNGSRLYGQEGETDLCDSNDIKKEFARITQMVEGWHRRGGPILMDMEQFSTIYHFLRQFYKRYGGMIVKLLFILSDEENIEARPYSLSDAVEKLDLCLQDALRKSDMILRYKANQFYVILQNLSEEDFPIVFRRIMDTWEAGETHSGIHIEYLMEYVIYEKECYDK